LWARARFSLLLFSSRAVVVQSEEPELDCSATYSLPSEVSCQQQTGAREIASGGARPWGERLRAQSEFIGASAFERRASSLGREERHRQLTLW
jgi:hypothetical protein